MERQSAKLLMEFFPRLVMFMRTEAFGEKFSQSGGLSVSQLRFLGRLGVGPTNLKTLASWLGVSLPATSRTADILVKKSLVSRVTDPSDRRNVILKITREGEEVLDQAMELGTAKLETRLEKLNTMEQKKVSDGLEILKRAFLKEDV